jgi:hypothetical protein
MKEEQLVPGRSYWLKLGTRTVPATVTALKHRIDVDRGSHVAARSARAQRDRLLQFIDRQPIAFDPYKVNRDTGGFILIDRLTNETAGAGMIDFALRRASNIHRQALTVSVEDRAALKGQHPRSFGSPGCPAPANRRSPTVSSRNCWHWAAIRCCSTATMSGMGSTATSALPTPTASRTSAGSARSPN